MTKSKTKTKVILMEQTNLLKTIILASKISKYMPWVFNQKLSETKEASL